MAVASVIFAVFKRNVLSYFSSVLGYLFIVAFVVTGAFLAFSPRFFTNNLATLDQLTQSYPLLLLFMIPAITMTCWSDEKRSGTDELLFTLPGSDLQILLGKYLAVLAVYTIALLFSVTHIFVLEYYSDPDWGVLFTTYVGYWLSGAALLSAGMFASSLTSSATVAFVLGAGICAIPVFIDRIAPHSEVIRELSISQQLVPFGIGLIPLSAVIYFVTLTLLMLYLNLVMITHRHWSGSRQTNMGIQYSIRCIAIAAILVSVNTLAAMKTYQQDFTSEQLYTFADTTDEIIAELDADRPVTIQAFISSNVPRNYVPVRKQLIGILQQFNQKGGSRLNVRIVPTEPFSEEADQAKVFGIEPEKIFSEREGRRVEDDVYMGLVVTSSYDEVVSPFIGAGTPIEYEITRSISTVTNQERLTVGILTTDANLISPSREWQIVTELKNAYNVVEVSPASEIKADGFDVLIAAMPSSLTEPEMENFLSYVRAGHPVMIFDDPFPLFMGGSGTVTNAPRQPKPSPGGNMGMMGMRQPQGPPKADGGRATALVNLLQIEWVYDQIVWDTYNPHPMYEAVPAEYLFISPKSGVDDAINPNSEITSGLQEVLALFSGTIKKRANSNLEFTPLLRTSESSNLLNWDEFTDMSFSMFSPTPAVVPKANIRHDNPDDYSHVIAARIQSSKDSAENINVIYVADIDMLSDFFFIQQDRADYDLKLDNVAFILNSIDALADNNDYLDLRKRREKLRTLTEIEKEKNIFINERLKQEEQAEKEKQDALQAARKRFADQRKKIEEDVSLDPNTKSMMVRNLLETEERRLEVQEANLERAKNEKIQEYRAIAERKIRDAENSFRIKAVLFPPVPAILLGIFMLCWRIADERKDIAPERRR